MVTESGVIKEIGMNDKALVLVQRASCCAHCSSHGVCRSLSEKENLIEVINDLHAQVGDRVEISLPTGSFLKISFFVYVAPVVALVIGAVLGEQLASSFQWDSTPASLLTGSLAMIFTFLGVKQFDHGANSNKQYWPRITRLLPPSNSPQPDDSK